MSETQFLPLKNEDNIFYLARCGDERGKVVEGIARAGHQGRFCMWDITQFFQCFGCSHFEPRTARNIGALFPKRG